MKLEGSDYYVCLVPFPNYAADGFCKANSDCTDTIVINANLPVERWAEVCEHELRHLLHDDLYHDGDVADMERRANESEK